MYVHVFLCVCIPLYFCLFGSCVPPSIVYFSPPYSKVFHLSRCQGGAAWRHCHCPLVGPGEQCCQPAAWVQICWFVLGCLLHPTLHAAESACPWLPHLLSPLPLCEHFLFQLTYGGCLPQEMGTFTLPTKRVPWRLSAGLLVAFWKDPSSISSWAICSQSATQV